jgi:glycosyltransferase involved in cell wall biosynthesis
MVALQKSKPDGWPAGVVPVAVIMISLNERHNMGSVLQNLSGWAQEVFLVDSYSQDDTVDIALRHGVHVVQRKFRGFGDQWNFALRELPVTAPWTMKLDPDERISNALKGSIEKSIAGNTADGLILTRRLWFMGRALPVRQELLRLWKTGQCKFTEVAVNEHPLVDGRIGTVSGDLEHHDSPNLYHWFEKQNRYTTAEAESKFHKRPMAVKPDLWGTSLQRRMWLKARYQQIPFRHFWMFVYCYLVLGAWRAGWVGYVWSRLRSDVFRFREYKFKEMQLMGCAPASRVHGPGAPDSRVSQFQ